MKEELEYIFTLARIKQVELEPANEAKIERLISIKKELFALLTEKEPKEVKK